MKKSVRRMSTLAAMVVVATVGSVGASVPVAASADPTFSTIEASGPLSLIGTGTDLSCILYDRLGASDYLATACGVVIAVGDRLFSPANLVGAGQVGEVYSAPSSGPAQTGGKGSSTPNEIITTVRLGDTGLHAVQVDQYVPGERSFSTTITVLNDSGVPVNAHVYRLLGCRLGGSDATWTSVEPSLEGDTAATCFGNERLAWMTLSAQNLSVNPAPASSGAHQLHRLLERVSARESFAGFCKCSTTLGNAEPQESNVAAGLHWGSTIPAGSSQNYFSELELFTDRDADSLPDDWETDGVVIDGMNVPLDLWGADPDRKDVFLQINWMDAQRWRSCGWVAFWQVCTNSSHNFAPTRAEIQKVVDAFRDAPVSNPDGSTGITLHVDAGSVFPRKNGNPWPDAGGGMSLPYSTTFVGVGESAADAANDLRDHLIAENRREVFRLAIFGGKMYPNSNSSGEAELPGDAFYVAEGLLKSSPQVSATLMHELGHTIGLMHGGPMTFEGRYLNCKPAYRSVMNYLYQLSGDFIDYSRTSSEGNAPPSPNATNDYCTYPDTTYDTASDWPELFFHGAGGGSSQGSEQEPSLDLLEEEGLLGADGDGGIRLLSPMVLFEGKEGSIQVEVSNVGNIESDYDVEVIVGATTVKRSVTVGALDSVVVDIPVPATEVVGDELLAAAAVFAPGGTVALTVDELGYAILPDDPAAAREVLLEAESLTLTPEQETLLDVIEPTLEEIAGGPSVDRLAGPDRYATAVEVSREFEPGVPIVYVATGQNYPDALSAGAAAAAQGGPVLLTTKDALPAIVKTELERLDPDQIVIVGDEASVSTAVESQLAAYGPVDRDGGADRYETSRLVIERAFENATTVYVATGVIFPDALSATPAAVSDNAPVLLVPGTWTDLPAATAELLSDLGTTEVIVAGGPTTVSPGIQADIDALPNVSVVRKAGADRFGTSLLLNQHAFDSADTVFLATGLTFPDALAGGALAGIESAPLFAVLQNCIPDASADEIERLGPSRIVLLGGTPSLATSIESLTRC